MKTKLPQKKSLSPQEQPSESPQPFPSATKALPHAGQTTSAPRTARLELSRHVAAILQGKGPFLPCTCLDQAGGDVPAAGPASCRWP